MTLVLEPVNYTLKYFLHQLDRTLSIVETVSVVQQIAGAALYLQECGYIHSNISSYNVLVREDPRCVKLSSFELTTELDYAETRVEILVNYRHSMLAPNSSSTDAPLINNYKNRERHANMTLKEKYRRLSKMEPILMCSPDTKHRFLSMKSKHLIYDTHYREHLSLHYYQAPELLTTKRLFVFPTPKTDVYSLCLLLWETLNNCVPFVVYNKLDMERMISTKKLSLPYFERERCKPFMDIFRIGLAVKPEDRSIDVKQLIAELDDIRCRIQSGDRGTIKKKPNATPEKMSRTNADSTLSPISRSFNLSLENELTSTKKKRRKTPQKSATKKKIFRQLFTDSREPIDRIENNAEFDSPLNENLDSLAIRRQLSLDEIKEEGESLYRSIVGPVVVKENELPTKNVVKRPTGRQNVEWRKTSPEAMKFEVNNHDGHSVNSKSCDILFDASESRTKAFQSNSGVSPQVNGEFSLPNTPIAHKNRIRRNAWLSNKSLNASAQEADELDVEKQLNVSIRIVHSKVTPQKTDKPSVLSRIKFFDSASEASGNVPSPSNKINNTGVESNYPVKKSNSKEILETPSSDRQDSLPSTQLNVERIDAFSNRSTATTSQRRSVGSAQTSRRRSNVDNKVTMSRSMSEIETADNSNVIQPKWQSVQDRIRKFEKCREPDAAKPPMSSFLMASEYFKNLEKSSTGNKTVLAGAPTVIKRTIFQETIVSGVNLTSLDSRNSPEQQGVTGQTLTTQVTLSMREVRRRSTDSDTAERRKLDAALAAENQPKICGSQKGLMSFFCGHVKDEALAAKAKYICSDCSSKLQPDGLNDRKSC